MPQYRMKPGHKHYHAGQRYEGKQPGKPKEYPDVLELDEERASRISNKLDLVGSSTDPVVIAAKAKAAEEKKAEPEQENLETFSSVLADTEEEEQTSKDEKKEEGSPDSDSEKSDPKVEDSPVLSVSYLGDGKWNVMQNGKPVNDAPLTEAEAKALAGGK